MRIVEELFQLLVQTNPKAKVRKQPIKEQNSSHMFSVKSHSNCKQSVPEDVGLSTL